jgi:CO dehydrogenase maturation factor
MDMEAGIEHLGRGTTKGIDLMIVVVEPGMRSIETARRIKGLAEEIGIRHLAAVVNKGTSVDVRPKLAEIGISVLGEIPYSSELMVADFEGKAPLDAGLKNIGSFIEIKEKMLWIIRNFNEEEQD